MAIGAGSLVEITVVGDLGSDQWMNVFTYVVVGELGSPTAANIGEAFWNAVKDTYRPIVSSGWGSAFREVRVREMDDPMGEFGVWAIPSGERAGTGTAGAGGRLPSFNAAGIRLTVGSRVTRPGQKRIPGADEADANSQAWEGSYMTVLEAFADVIDSNQVLGSPAVGTEISPVVVRRDPATGLPVAHQPVIGHVVNPYITSQVSRKIGRGS